MYVCTHIIYIYIYTWHIRVSDSLKIDELSSLPQAAPASLSNKCQDGGFCPAPEASQKEDTNTLKLFLPLNHGRHVSCEISTLN